MVSAIRWDRAVRKPLRRVLLLAAAIAMVPQLAFAAYKLQAGDVLDVLIAGIVDFHPHVAIGLEGHIGLPLAGDVAVGGLTLAQARTRIADQFANKLYRQYTTDGREISHLILGSEVVVEIAEYNPIYVTGDVSRPGVYPFRPGMTVRQVIAVAGGVNAMRAQVSDPAFQAVDLQAQYNALMADYEGQLALVWRLRKELDPGGSADDKQDSPPQGAPMSVVKGEMEDYSARKAGIESNKAMLRAAMSQETLQLNLLAEKKVEDQKGYQADNADYDSVRALARKGLATTSRLADARRAALLSSEQLLQTIASMGDVERQRGDYERQLQQIDNQARIDELDKLLQANGHIAELRATMEGVTDKLALIGSRQTKVDDKVELSVFRREADGSHRIPTAEDLELVPGDVVNVVLPHDTSPGLLASSAPAR